MLHNNSQDVVINCAEIYHLNKVFIDQIFTRDCLARVGTGRKWEINEGEICGGRVC